jgi:hypothetical protein
MRKIRVVVLIVATTLGVAVLAGELKRIQVPTSKGAPQVVVVYSGKEVVAELKVIKPGTLNLEAGDVVWHTVPGGKNDYSCTGGSTLELLADGKSVLKLSGECMLLPSADPNLKAKGPN